MFASLPKVSVIVPVYNAGKYLAPCIRSLANQDCGQDVEFVCVNDGSTDDSPQALDEWAARDSRVRVLHQENKGYGKAMNAGLSMARGAYVGIVEPDDWVELDMFSSLLTLAEQSGADIVKGAYIGESEGSIHVDTRYNHRSNGETSKPTDIPEFVFGAPSIWAAIYRKSMLDEHKILFSETPGASFQDFGFFMRTWAAAERITTTNHPGYHYREDNPNSSTRRKEEGAWAVIREIQLCKPLFHQLADCPEKRSILVRRVFHSLQADFRQRINKTLDAWLQACSDLLRDLCPHDQLLSKYFNKREWHDIQLLYHRHKDYPSLRQGGVSALQRIFSIRSEGGYRYLRILGGRFKIGKI